MIRESLRKNSQASKLQVTKKLQQCCKSFGPVFTEPHNFEVGGAANGARGFNSRSAFCHGLEKLHARNGEPVGGEELVGRVSGDYFVCVGRIECQLTIKRVESGAE